MSYELWDSASGNLVHEYGTEAEALDVVADLVSRYRSRRGKQLTWLSLHGPDANGTFRVLARGPDLVARALARPAVEAPVRHVGRRKRAAA